MKILAVVAALAIAIGPEALVVRADERSPAPKLRVIFDGISRLVIDGYIKVSRKFDLVRQSKSGKAVSDQFEQLLQPLDNLDREVREELSALSYVVFDVPWGIAEKASRTFQEVERRSPANLEHVLETLAAYLEPTLEKATSYAEPLLTPLAEKIIELDQEMNERIAQTMESLDGQLSFYVKRVEEIREGLQPLAEEVGKQCRLGIETLNKNLKPYLDPLLEETSKYKDAFREWVRAPLYPTEES